VPGFFGGFFGRTGRVFKIGRGPDRSGSGGTVLFQAWRRNVKDVISPSDDDSSPLDDDPFHVNHVNHVPAPDGNWKATNDLPRVANMLGSSGGQGTCSRDIGDKCTEWRRATSIRRRCVVDPTDARPPPTVEMPAVRFQLSRSSPRLIIAIALCAVLHLQGAVSAASGKD
jgi:hypothetical protein